MAGISHHRDCLSSRQATMRRLLLLLLQLADTEIGNEDEDPYPEAVKVDATAIFVEEEDDGANNERALRCFVVALCCVFSVLFKVDEDDDDEEENEEEEEEEDVEVEAV
jgi:hypothetical protein